MKLTLYKSCIVNNNYDEVFATRDLIDEYLLKLSKRVFDIVGVYPQYSGTLQFEYDSSFYDYNALEINHFKRDIMSSNYCVIEDENIIATGKVYAFINSIEITNGICFLSYTTDLWHTYLGYWDFRQGLLTKSLRTYLYHGLKEKNYPCTIFTNSEALVSPFEDDKISENKCYILVTLQLYKLQSGSDTKVNRITQSYILVPYPKDNTDKSIHIKNGEYQNDTFTPYNDVNTLQGIINLLIKSQSELHKVFTNYPDKTVVIDEMYYDITNVYLIPFDANNDIFTSNYDDKATRYNFAIYKDDKQGDYIYCKPLVIGEEYIIYNKSVAYSPLKYAIGFYTKKVEINNNGMDTHAIITLSTRDDRLYFYLETSNKIIDISECFNFDLPWLGVTAETLAQRKVSTALENASINNSIANTTADITGNLIKGALNFAGTNYMFQNENIMGLTGAGNKLTDNIVGIAKGISNLTYAFEKDKAVNAQKYANSKANSTVAQSVINLLYGFSVFSYGSYTNYAECEQKLLEVGYDVAHLITTFPTSDTQENSKYEIMKFDFVRLNGLPTDINDAIKQIMLNGFKLWFNSNV